MVTEVFEKVTKNLYNKAASAVFFNSSIEDWFRPTAGVRQGCLLSPTLFNIFLERIMTDALEDQKSTVSIGGRTITNNRFADDIDGSGEQGRMEKTGCEIIGGAPTTLAVKG